MATRRRPSSVFFGKANEQYSHSGSRRLVAVRGARILGQGAVL
jgi:hypothetical protein